MKILDGGFLRGENASMTLRNETGSAARQEAIRNIDGLLARERDTILVSRDFLEKIRALLQGESAHQHGDLIPFANQSEEKPVLGDADFTLSLTEEDGRPPAPEPSGKSTEDAFIAMVDDATHATRAEPKLPLHALVGKKGEPSQQRERDWEFGKND